MNTTRGNISQYCALYSFDYVLENLLHVIEIMHIMPALHTKSLSQSIYMGYICEFWQEKQQQFKLSKTYIRSSTYKIWYSSSIQSIVGVIGNTYQSCDISIQVSANTKFTGCPRKTRQNFFLTLYPFFGRFWPPDDPNTLQTPN